MAGNKDLNIITLVAFMCFLVGGMVGYAAHMQVDAVALNEAEVSMFETLDTCGYVRHPIADMAWIYVNKGVIPPGTARFYSSRMTSKNNKQVIDCIEGLVG